MDIDINTKATILSNALPHIQRYYGKVVVVKYGGNAMLSEQLKDAVMHDIVMLSLIGVKVVLVHGGGPEINDMLKKVGKEPAFINGLRYTDKETADIVLMVLAGKVNKGLVNKLESCGGRAIGLCGCDGGMIKAEKRTGVDLGYVGEVKDVDVRPIRDALDNGYIPVIATVSCGEDGQIYNINADLISEVNVSEVPVLVKKGIISGGMIPKVECCVEAVRRGVKQSLIIDGRIPHAILIECLTDEGVGTMFI